ncbi:hypothetical protein ASPCAL00970 [Aspergillus calidoustus]|uniref:RanBD1 domain-containing protein n=1 Tax=Aspergillus calidoustus TaxID=454130 RepID=A0A0U5C1X3_ASPCI|nr:hypothetical protein ASPCAL00970 [Aspergillus calidoustus]
MASEIRDKELEKDNQNGPVDQTTTDDSQASDNDGGERPVRNKLKETSITAAPKTTSTTFETAQEGESSRESSRGRKRSFDDDEMENTEDEPGHRRKRSRDSSTEEPTTKPDEGLAPESGSTLKKKRSRDQLDKDEKTEEKGEKPNVKDSTEGGASAGTPAAEGQPEKKRHRDDSQERGSVPLPSAFANTSSVSPFGSVGGLTSTSKPAEEEKPATSSSAFASSSLAAFASSEQSPFGSLGASTPSIFKSSAESTPAETTKPAATGFSAATKPSGFAALGSGFSGFSGGFGGAGSSGGLTSFASATAPSALGSTSSKPFGAEADSDDEDDKEDDGDSEPAEFAEDKTDERFFERRIETGEEEEKTYFSCKAKLFHFSDKEWKERGLGTFKVNVKVTDGVEDKKSARMIMRADGVHRVMLNSPLFRGMTIGDATGKEPKSKQISLASLENSRTVPLLLRTGSEDQAKELYRVLQDLLEHQ